MNKGYYYVFSSNMITYNNRNGGSKTRRRVHINNNGKKDYYYKESIVEEGNEKVIKEEGNKNLEKMPDINRLSNFKIDWDKFFFPWLYYRLPSSTKKGSRKTIKISGKTSNNMENTKLITSK